MTNNLKLQNGEDLLKGVLEKIIFYNEENHYCIGEFKSENNPESITITGNIPGVQCGETLQLAGIWGRHPQHGEQFKFRDYRSTLPASVYGIRKYLGSGLVPGIGKIYANKIVDYFGKETLQVISSDSGRLSEIQGIGKQRAQSIKKAWEEQQNVRDVMMFLQTYGVSTNQCLRIVKTYGNNAKEILQTHPYKIAREIKGIGFKTADQIAINIGFANNSPERIDAGILYSLETLEEEGHSGYPIVKFKSYATELLNSDITIISDRLNILIDDKNIKLRNSDFLQLPASEYAENKISQGILNLLQQKSSLPDIKITAAIDWAQKRNSNTFAEKQASAIESCLTNKISIITGGPGTGKTTILKAVVDILNAKKAKIVLASPTGRAAKRLSDATGHPAQTIHRLLKYDPIVGKFTVNETNPFKCNMIIIDEASMLDIKLAAALLRAIPNSAHLTLVGDINQLPSVGPGNVLKDIIESKKVKVIELIKIFRQENESSIISAAYSVLSGNTKQPTTISNISDIDRNNDFHFIAKTTPEECLITIVELCQNYIPKNFSIDPILDLQIISPMHKGVAGISNINRELQSASNLEKSGILMGTNNFKKNDKVIQTRNNYNKNVFNGDLGKISKLDRENKSLSVEFENDTVDYERIDITDLQLAYAISVHKSQGSEFQIIIIALLKQHYMMLQQNLLYTAITRGSKQVFIVGDPAAYYMAVKNKVSSNRYTSLRELLS